MLKVLVADENPEANSDCCQYLSDDKDLNILSVLDGFDVVNKYYETEANILVINSNFNDKKCTQIVNELSITTKERNNCNIFLTVDKNTNLSDLNYMAKIYKLFYYPANYTRIKESIYQFKLDNKDSNFNSYEPNDTNLMHLFYKIHLYNGTIGERYLKDAIKECYKNPSLLNSLNDILRMLANKENVQDEYIRSSMRQSLKIVENYRSSATSNDSKVYKLFENEDTITPKNFIKIITTYYLLRKKTVKY